MGLLDASAAKARTRQRDSLVEEAAKVGSQVVEVADSVDASTAGSILGGTLKSLVGGRVKTDFHQALLLRTGATAHLYVQPYQGVQAMPGEHHIVLGGTLPVAAILRRKAFGRTQWEGGHGDHAFNRNQAIAAATQGLVWTWKAGFTEIELPWTAQIRPLAGGRAHLVVAAGRYGGFTTYHVGFGPFLRLAGAVQAALVQAPQIPGAEFLEPSWSAPLAAALS